MTEFNGMNGTIMLNIPDSPGLWIGTVSGEDYGYKRRLSVSVEMRIEREERSEFYQTTTHETVTRPLSFALTSAVWTPNKSDWVSGGATVEPIREVAAQGHLNTAFTPEQLTELADLGERWHLNTMRAGCAHQERAVDPDGNALTATGYALDNTPPCPLTGYRYGSSWLVEPLPEDFLARLDAILDNVEPGRIYRNPELGA